MFDTFEGRVVLTGTLTTVTALRIGAGRETGVTGTDLPVVRDSLGLPYIPGSSFKGALRASIEAALRTLPGGRACDPLGDACVPNRDMEAWQRRRRLPRGHAEFLTDAQLTEALLAQTCDACRLFGSPWLASRVSVRDLLVDQALWFGQYEVRNGVALDRDTETASDKRLYDFEVVPQGTRFACQIVVDNAVDWELGLLAIGLRPFERGEAALGGSRSRGLGVVRLEWTARKRVRPERLLEYLADGTADDVADDEVAHWVRALAEELRRPERTGSDAGRPA